MNAGSLSTGSETLGEFGAGTFNQSGGVHTVGSIGSPSFVLLGAGQGASGHYLLSGTGSFVVDGDFYDSQYPLGPGDGVLSVSGGSMSVSGTLIVSSNPNTVVNLNGGQISVGSINVIGDPSQFNWTAGTFSFLNGVTVDSSFYFGSTVTLPTGKTLGSGTSLNNNGQIILNGGGIAATSALINNTIITGNGTNTTTGGSNNNQITQSGGNISLYANSAPFNNNYNLTLANPYSLLLYGAGLTNHGSMQLAGAIVGGSATLANAADGVINGPGQIQSPFTNLGRLNVPAGQTNVAAFTNGGVIELASTSANLGGGQTITNSATIEGFGQISAGIINNSTIEATGGTLVLTGAVTNSSTGVISAPVNDKVLMQGAANFPANAGNISLTGGEFSNGGAALTNSGTINGRGTFRSGGLSNTGNVNLSGGFTDVYGSVTNSGKITITGGSTTTFYNDVNTTSGSITVNSNSTAVFLGNLTGQSKVLTLGSGILDFEAAHSGGPIVASLGNVLIGPGSRAPVIRSPRTRWLSTEPQASHPTARPRASAGSIRLRSAVERSPLRTMI